MKSFKMTEEKVRKLKPIVERILSRKYARDIKLINLTVGEITICDKDRNE